MFSDKESFKNTFIQKLESNYGKCVQQALTSDFYKILGCMVMEYIREQWIDTDDRYTDNSVKQVYYLSMEFLLGRLLSSNLLNLGVKQICVQGLKELGIDFEKIEDEEHDAGLGNGGLGRLAACFLDSMASLNLPGHGCGIRYKYGLFEQKIIDGYQVEMPEDWLREGNVWEITRPDQIVEIKFGGYVKLNNNNGQMVFEHEGYQSVLGVRYDIPVIGYQNKTINTLQLWSAESKDSVGSITELLYPDDSIYEGRTLRLKQEYFLVSASIQSIVAGYKKKNGSLANFEKKVAIHLNDTHPVLAIPELLRILLDEENIGWEKAWAITTQVMSYTNHTTLSEALEKWPVDMVKALLPRIYMLIDEINERFCKKLWDIYPGQWDKISRLAVTAHGQIKMAPLAMVGSHSVNGVSKIHTHILKNREMREYFDIFPEKFNNKTNGVSHRRWLLQANPSLAKLISDTIGTNWIHNPLQLTQLLNFTKDPSFKEQIINVKTKNKIILEKLIKAYTGISVDPQSIFDVQVKRLHLYKRQLLNILHIIDLYNRLQSNASLDIAPRTFIFGAKAAPSYQQSKKVIKLINTLADKVNKDRRINEKIKIIFLQNYRVTLAEKIIPAADISEQISTASKEASGTGNMKFMMNGAITVGTLDGANIEIKEAVGDENIFTFGLNADEVLNFYNNGGYDAWDLYHSDARLKTIIDQIHNGFYTIDKNEFDVIYHSLLSYNDEFFVLKDFAEYVRAQEDIDKNYHDTFKWAEMCIHNIAQSGNFSSDYTVLKYAQKIWGLHCIHDDDVLTENDSHCIIKN